MAAVGRHAKVLLAFSALLGLAACGDAGSARRPAEPLAKNGLPVPKWKGIVPTYLTIHIGTIGLRNVGFVLADGTGRPFYAFEPDRRRAVTCTGACSLVWRPFTIRAVQALDLLPSLDSRLLGADSNPKGAHVVTFGGWPLYRYVGDTLPYAANGQGVRSYGGRWYLVSRSGTLVTGSLR